jgi:hypothetical protein
MSSRSPELAPRGDRNRIRWDQIEIRNDSGPNKRQLTGVPVRIRSGAYRRHRLHHQTPANRTRHFDIEVNFVPVASNTAGV